MNCERKLLISLILTNAYFYIAKACHEVIQPPINGNLYCNGNRTNNTCHYTCNSGYVLSDSSPRTCQPNGRWSGIPSFCSPLPCPTLTPPSNGYLQLPCDGVYQSQCIIRCFDGYKLASTNDTTSAMTCDLLPNNETTWSSTEKCQGEYFNAWLKQSRFILM